MITRKGKYCLICFSTSQSLPDKFVNILKIGFFQQLESLSMKVNPKAAIDPEAALQNLRAQFKNCSVEGEVGRL
jgi:hypothetical protein